MSRKLQFVVNEELKPADSFAWEDTAVAFLAEVSCDGIECGRMNVFPFRWRTGVLVEVRCESLSLHGVSWRVCGDKGFVSQTAQASDN